MATDRLPFTADVDAQALLARNPTALLVGIVLYQQIPVEKAFAGPAALQARLGRELSVTHIAEMDPEALEAAFREPPALHRFPVSMAKRTQAVCRHIAEVHGGDVAALWRGAEDAGEVMARLTAVPGFGEYKARMYLGVLAKWFDVRPAGWEGVVPDWPTITDVDGLEDLESLKLRKKAWKAAGA